jgi:hypothetical protein
MTCAGNKFTGLQEVKTVPADITPDQGISAIAPLPSVAETASASLSSSGATQVTTATTSSASSSPKLPNPQLTVDPSTARVVYEYFSSTGVLTNSIPSQQQLQAYRLAAESGGDGQAG